MRAPQIYTIYLWRAHILSLQIDMFHFCYSLTLVLLDCKDSENIQYFYLNKIDVLATKVHESAFPSEARH